MSKLITDHVKVQDKSGREALQNFIGGNGDVLLSYEYEATPPTRRARTSTTCIPDDTIKINIDIATTKDAPRRRRKTFLDYVLSRARRRSSFADWGYRPVNEEVLRGQARTSSPTRPGLFTIEDLGGWEKVNDELFDIENGSIAKIEEDAGVSTAK